MSAIASRSPGALITSGPPGPRGKAGPIRDEVIANLEEKVDYLRGGSTDSMRETWPAGLRRWIKMTRITGADRMPGPLEVYLGQREGALDEDAALESEPSDESSEDVWFNCTSAAQSLIFLSRYAQFQGGRQDLVETVDLFARTLLRLQWTGVPGPVDKMLRRGGFRLAPSDSRTGTFSTGLAARGLLEAFKATGTIGFLNGAIDACDYLMRMARPNDFWLPNYGVTPLADPTVQGKILCDRADATDKISTVATMWNLEGARALWEVGYEIGNAQGDDYIEVAEGCRDFMAYGLLGGYDYYAPETNWPTYELTAPVVPGDSTVHMTRTSPTGVTDLAAPWTLSFSGESMTVTGAPTGDAYPVTRLVTIDKQRSYGHDLEAFMAQPAGLGYPISAAWTLDARAVFNSGGWHRLGSSIRPATGSYGTDQAEYPFPILRFMNYNRFSLRARYEYLAQIRHSGGLLRAGLSAYSGENSDGGLFGEQYDLRKLGEVCWPGLFRFYDSENEPTDRELDRGATTYLDGQGACTMAGYVANEYPEHFERRRQLLMEAHKRGSLLNYDYETKWGHATGATVDTTKRGTIVVAAAALGLLNYIEQRM